MKSESFLKIICILSFKIQPEEFFDQSTFFFSFSEKNSDFKIIFHSKIYDHNLSRRLKNTHLMWHVFDGEKNLTFIVFCYFSESIFAMSNHV